MKKDQAYSRSFERYHDLIIAQAKLAFNDDVGDGDITTQALFQNKGRSEEAIVIAKDDGVLCGVLEAKMILEDGGLAFESQKTDGDSVRKGEIIAKVRGDIRELLKRERTVLNYMQVLSGISTATYNLAKQYPGKVASLRKTHPGLCYSEKRAVKVGMGLTHRLGLYDGFLIKDNHLAIVVKEIFGKGTITEEKKIEAIKRALNRIKEYRSEHGLDNYFIEVEVESLKQAIAAAKLHKEEGVPDMILLDNMEPQEVSKCVKAIRKEAGRGILIESSGGVTAENIDTYIKAGVDVISTSKITLSAKPLDISMKIVGYK